jgi:putative CocE/NonD family hydrolase
MPDGATLAASLYRPQGASSALATVLMRLPYGRRAFDGALNPGLFFARHGYAVLIEDLRGTGDSDGELLPWRDVAGDGVTTLEWIARQPWSNGRVGTFGCSALGETQLILAKRNHPVHTAIIASGAGGAIGSMQGRYGYFGVFEGGVFQLASGFGWFAEHGSLRPRSTPARKFDTGQVLQQLPLSTLVSNLESDPNGYGAFLGTPIGDPKWDEWGYLTDKDLTRIPALIINTWHDQTVGDALAMAEHSRRTVPEAARDQRVVIAAGAHCDHEGIALPPAFEVPDGAPTTASYQAMYLRWFDRWLRGVGEGLADMAPYTYYMLGENRWYEAKAWPPEKAVPQRWHLDSDGGANTSAGDGRLARTGAPRSLSDTFEYDPLNPVPSRGGAACCTGNPDSVVGSVDQVDVESRADVLVFTSAPLTQDLHIAGPLTAVLNVSSDAPDTDLVARLADVGPDGKSFNIQEGALRLRYRDGVPAKPLEAGRQYRVTVDMRSIAYRIEKGHRLRLDITSSSFPRLERNLNTGGDNYNETVPRTATNAVHHGPDVDSYLELSALPES